MYRGQHDYRPAHACAHVSMQAHAQVCIQDQLLKLEPKSLHQQQKQPTLGRGDLGVRVITCDYSHPTPTSKVVLTSRCDNDNILNIHRNIDMDNDFATLIITHPNIHMNIKNIISIPPTSRKPL